MKENAYEELNKEYRHVKQNFEKQNASLEQTMVAEIQGKDQKQLELTQKIDRMANDIEDLR